MDRDACGTMMPANRIMSHHVAEGILIFYVLYLYLYHNINLYKVAFH